MYLYYIIIYNTYYTSYIIDIIIPNHFRNGRAGIEPESVCSPMFSTLTNPTPPCSADSGNLEPGPRNHPGHANQAKQDWGTMSFLPCFKGQTALQDLIAQDLNLVQLVLMSTYCTGQH